MINPLRLSLFFAFIVGLAALGVGLLAGSQGFFWGALAGIAILVFIGVGASKRALRAMGARPLLRIDYPPLQGIVAEYSRRLGIACPKLSVIEVRGVYAAALGIRRNSGHLVVSKEALARLSRRSLCGLVHEALLRLASGEAVHKTWVTALEALFLSPSALTHHGSASYISERAMRRHLLLFPFFVLPRLLLGVAARGRLLPPGMTRKAQSPWDLWSPLFIADQHQTARQHGVMEAWV